MNIEVLEKAATRAHQGTSFSPERRGEQMAKEYTQIIESDVNFLQENGVEAEIIEGYKTKFSSLLLSWLSAKSRVYSPMITGPANFPVRRMEKIRRSEENHYKVFNEWRERAKKAILRKAKEPKTYESELARYKEELAGMTANHEKMKLANAAMKKKGADKVQILVSTFPQISAFDVEWVSKWGFGLQNNLANIKRVEERIRIIESKQAAENKERVYSWGKVELNYDDDRMRIRHNERPDSQTISLLKSHGFKWSPSNTAWQRQITGNAFYVLNNLLLPKLGA